MKLNELIEKNNREFEEKFVRDDGLMDKYTWEGTKEGDVAPQPMAEAIKSHLHASQLSIVEYVGKELENMIIKDLEERSSTTLQDRLAIFLLQLNNLQ